MPELQTPEGEAVPLDLGDSAAVDPASTEREFSRAMATDTPGEDKAPPRRDAAPGAEGTKRGPGRPRGSRNQAKDEKARVSKPPAPRVDVNYREAAEGVTTLAWATLAAIPYTTPYAAVVDANQAQLIVALENGAKHNDRIAAVLAASASGGGGVYALQLAAVGVNMSMQALEIMRDPETRAAAMTATQRKFRAFLGAQGVHLADQPEAADREPAAA